MCDPWKKYIGPIRLCILSNQVEDSIYQEGDNLS